MPSPGSACWALGILDDFIEADILIDDTHTSWNPDSPNLFDFTSSQKGILQFVPNPSTDLVRDWTVLKDGDTIPNEPVISEIKSILTALSNETPYDLRVQDGFNDNDKGTDIFSGGDHDLGGDGKFEITTDEWKTNNLKNLKKRLSGWQLDSFNESYEYKINNGMSLFKKEFKK